ncbi:hypothetical protein [Ruegeria atlantica]|uniref:hypothetical protein n=1 Tax=Ruegeria atlantica TaxID=81569 RepID=UPI00147C846A|nr:hypothetical protein [Ruegeria atlantica]
MKPEHINEFSGSILGVISSAVVAAGYWVVRRVLTDTKRLSLLEQRQDMQHQEIVNAIKATREQVAQIETSNNQTTQTQAQIAEVLERLEKRGSE